MGKKLQDFLNLNKVPKPAPVVIQYNKEYRALSIRIFKLMLKSGEESLIYSQYAFDQESKQVYGFQLRLDLVSKYISQLFSILNSPD